MQLSNPHLSMPPFRSPQQAFQRAAAIFLDWDGCVMIGSRLVPGARTLLQRHGDRIVILSNNSTHLPEDFSRILQQAGVHIPAERIVLAGAEAVRWTSQDKHARVMLLGSARIKGCARQMGLTLVREAPDQILLMRDTRFTYAKLCRAANALHGGARLIVANGDVTHPGTDGEIVPETGAVLAALLACAPNTPVMTVGKPGPLLFSRACDIAGVSPGQAVMIGDNPLTDGKGATDYGIHPILIGPGTELTLEDMLAW